MTKTINNKLEIFQHRCLRCILHIYWPNKITNEELYRRTKTESISMQVKRRCLQWTRQQPYPELPYDGLKMAEEREAAPRRLGGEP
jgi:hypothetical protein